MRGLQGGIAFVESVARPVVVEREDLRRAVRAHRAFAVTLFVDVVAEVHDQIEVFARQVFEGGVVSHLVFLARREREPQALRGGPGNRHRARAAAGADLGAGLELIPVPAIGFQAVDLDVHGVRPGRRGINGAAAHHA